MRRVAFHLFVVSMVSILLLSCGRSSDSIAKEVEGVAWEKTYYREGYECGQSVQQTSDGGYVIVGPTADDGWDIWLLRTDADGNKLWDKTIGGSFADDGYCGQQTSDGGYIVVGSTMQGTSWEDVYDRGGEQVWLVKTDADGNEVWNSVFPRECGGTGYYVEQTFDGGYILVGDTGEADIVLIRTDANGNQLWEKTFGGEEYLDTARCVQEVAEGGYIVVGVTYTHSADGLPQLWLIRTDADGHERWNKTFGETIWSSDCFVQQTSDGGYVLLGTASYETHTDIWLIRTDADGNELWSKTLGGDFEDQGNCVRQTTDGGFIVAGRKQFEENGDTNVYLAKVDSSGNMLWDLGFGGSSWDEGLSVIQTSDGGYVVTGITFRKLSTLGQLNCANIDRTQEQGLFLVKIVRDQ